MSTWKTNFLSFSQIYSFLHNTFLTKNTISDFTGLTNAATSSKSLTNAQVFNIWEFFIHFLGDFSDFRIPYRKTFKIRGIRAKNPSKLISKI